jgi:hypothetical protein
VLKGEPQRQIKPSELRTLDQMMLLTPTEFELAVGDLMNEMGFRRVSRIGGAGDLAVDLTARDGVGRTVAVQCKRYDPKGTVGSPEIQKFIGMTTTHHLTDRAIFVSTASYTKPAIELARKHKIELWDGAELARLLAEYRPPPGMDKSKSRFAAMQRTDVKLSRKEVREAARAAEEEAHEAQFRYEHRSSLGTHVPDASLDLARQSAAVNALRRRSPEHVPSEEEIDALVADGSPTQPTKRCPDCRGEMRWYEKLPGHYCSGCARIELWVADERKVLTPHSKRQARRFSRRY